jgi:hypothetical protein
MQNVVVFAPWFGVNSGGAEIALLKIGEGLRDLGCNVEFYTSRSLRPYEDWLLNPPAQEAEHYKGFRVRRFAVDAKGFDRFQFASQAMAIERPLQQGLRDDFFRYGLTSSELVDSLKALPEDATIIGGPYYQAMVHNAVAALPGRITVMPAFHEEAPFHYPAVNRLVRDARALMFLTEVEKALTIESHGDAMDRAKFETPVLSLPFVNEALPQANTERGLFGGIFDKYMLYIGRIDEGKNVRALMNRHHEMNETRLKQNRATIPLLMVGIRNAAGKINADASSRTNHAASTARISRVNAASSIVLSNRWGDSISATWKSMGRKTVPLPGGHRPFFFNS